LKNSINPLHDFGEEDKYAAGRSEPAGCFILWEQNLQAEGAGPFGQGMQQLAEKIHGDHAKNKCSNVDDNDPRQNIHAAEVQVTFLYPGSTKSYKFRSNKSILPDPAGHSAGFLFGAQCVGRDPERNGDVEGSFLAKHRDVQDLIAHIQ
jgi:hypothetical protein